jgi:hypothetical protein
MALAGFATNATAADLALRAGSGAAANATLRRAEGNRTGGATLLIGLAGALAAAHLSGGRAEGSKSTLVTAGLGRTARSAAAGVATALISAAGTEGLVSCLIAARLARTARRSAPCAGAAGASLGRAEFVATRDITAHLVFGAADPSAVIALRIGLLRGCLPDPERTNNSTGQRSSKKPKRLPPGHRARDDTREIVKKVFHALPIEPTRLIKIRLTFSKSTPRD